MMEKEEREKTEVKPLPERKGSKKKRVESSSEEEEPEEEEAREGEGSNAKGARWGSKKPKGT